MLALGSDVELEHLASDIAVMRLLQLSGDMLGHGTDVGNDPLRMTENVMVDPLHDIAFQAAVGAQIHTVCIIDISAFYNFIAKVNALKSKYSADGFQKFVHKNNSKPVGYSAVSTKYSGSARYLASAVRHIADASISSQSAVCTVPAAYPPSGSSGTSRS